MALLSDEEIKKAIAEGEITIEPFDEKNCLQPASYDMRVGKKALVTKSIGLEELKRRVEKGGGTEIDIEAASSVTIPAGGFALITTLETVKLSKVYVGHIGIRSYYTRKGLAILSGLQIDPGFDGVLVLGLCNLSPRSFTLDYGDPLCTIEIHKLNKEAKRTYIGKYTVEQKEGKLPKVDKDYLRTIETMSVSDLTNALLTLAGDIKKLTHTVNIFWIPLGLTLIVALITIIFK